MLDTTKLTNKSKIVVQYGNKSIECAVVEDHGCGITIVLPDGSLTGISKQHVESVVEQTSTPVIEQAHSREV